MIIVLATANQNKVIELTKLLPQGFELKGLKEIGISTEIPETGTTLHENAFLKASFVKNHLTKQNLNYPVLSDDSGLEVEALGNEPGVNSAIYAGVPKNDEANNLKLLNELKNKTKRQATFKTVLCFLDREVHYFEGHVNGTISYEARGQNGFGYDPIFIPQGYRSTFAELSQEIKNSLSHRAIAIKAFLQFIKVN